MGGLFYFCLNGGSILLLSQWGVYFASVSMRGLFCFCLNGGSILLLSQWGCLFYFCLNGGVYFASVSMGGLFCFCLNGGSILLLSQWGCLFCICLRFVNWSLELFWQCGVFYFSCCHDVIMLSRCYHVFPSLIILNIFLLFIATELLLVIANSCLERHLPHAWIAVCDCQ